MSHREKTLEGMRKAAAKGRRPGPPQKVSDAEIIAAIPLGTLAGAKAVGLTKNQFIRRRRRLEKQDDQ